MESSRITKVENTARLSSVEIQYIERELKLHPNPVFFENKNLHHTVYRMSNNTYVSVGEKIGSGFWGYVNIGMKYDLSDKSNTGKRCVIKSPKEKNVVGRFLNHVTHLNKRMENECALVKSMYGEGEPLHVQLNHRNKTVIILPFLGEMSLGKLLTNKDLMHGISITQWLRFFIILCEQLNSLHVTTNSLHRDIKPKNIGLTLDKTEQGFIFREINYFDYGNSHQKYQPGFWGIPRYQPIESNLGIFIPQINDERIDIYALGKTLLKVVNLLIRNSQTESERTIYNRCKQVFKNMTSLWPNHRLNLAGSINELMLINKQINQANNIDYRLSL